MSNPSTLTTLADWLTHIERQHGQTIALGLERVRQVKNTLNIPQTVPVITVAGTNGKGSVCAMLERILLCAGYRVGLYTSPHLLNYNERVRIAGEAMNDASLCDAFAQVEAARNDVPLTYFEFGTLAAWVAFAAAKVEVVILEVGLGGRLDAVNAFDTDCAIITSIDIDHTEYLGETRELIGFEKAGVLRAGKPAILGDAKPPTSVLKHAEKLGVNLQILGRDFGYSGDQVQWAWWSSEAKQEKARQKSPSLNADALSGDNSVTRRGELSVTRRGGLAHPALRGLIQLGNASVVMAALNALSDVLPVAMQDIRRGFAEVELPGRFQVLAGLPTVVLDVAHNPQAAGILSDSLGNMAFHPDTWAVFGMLSDKDIKGVVERIKGRIDHWMLATLDEPRGSTAEALKTVLAEQGIKPAGLFDTPAAAWQAARERAKENDRIVVFGSFHTVADVLRDLATGTK